MATMKSTKTGRIMLRCNTWSALVFANGLLSQERIKTLKDFTFTSLRGLMIYMHLTSVPSLMLSGRGQWKPSVRMILV